MWKTVKMTPIGGGGEIEDSEYVVLDEFDLLDNPHGLGDADLENEKMSMRNFYENRVSSLFL